GELETLVGQEPYRERPRAQLMLALYRSDRQADALAAFQEPRAALAELGLGPGATLRDLERRILTQAPSLQPQAPADQTRLRHPGALVPSSPFPFVGREAELEELRSLLARAESGEGGIVLVQGEPGGSKTRLVREFAHEAARRGALVLYGVSDAAVRTPYQP